MEEEVKGIEDYLAILNRRKKQLIFPIILIMIASVGLAYGLPSIFRSEATILIEQQEIPPDLVRSTVTSYAGERIQIISQRVMTTENLGKIIEEYGLYKEERDDTSLTLLVEELREDIELEMISADVVDPRSGRPTTATIAFKLSFSNQDPRIAQKVTNELVSLYLNENLKRRTQSALATSGFLGIESEKLGEQVAELETQLAAFKERNINNLPELQQLNLQLMERSERELASTDQQIRTLEERSIYLRSELAQMSPTSDLYSSDGKRVLGAEDRLMALQSEFVGLKARYLANHPDLIKMGREIEALKRETGASGDVNEYRRQLKELKAEMAALSERYSAKHPDVEKLQRATDSTQSALSTALETQKASKRIVDMEKADNPAYIQIQTQLRATEGELVSLKRAREEIKTKIIDFEQRLMQSPQVEREYRNLSRDYENALAKYQEVRAKQLEAELAESLERERKGERFSLIEPPQLPEKPDKPNRLAILFLGFVFSFAGGFGNIALRESMDQTVHSTKDVFAIAQAPPLAVIPYIKNSRDLRRHTLRLTQVILSLILAIVTGAAVVHYFMMPLDVLWYVLLRKLGIETGI